MFRELITQDSELILLLLEKRKSLTIEELAELTNYQERYICVILGWLSNENKIIFSDDADDEFISIKLNK